MNPAATMEAPLQKEKAPHEGEAKGGAGIVHQVAADAKRLATLRAQAALRGITLYDTEGDDGAPLYVVSRWALTRQLRTLDDVEAWLALVSGSALGAH